MTAMALIVTGILCAPPAPPAPPPTPTENRHSLLKKATSWGYQLQKANINELAASSHDVLVIDYAREDGTPWTEAEIQQLKQRAGRPRTVLAYISVGEAEDYRPYWRKDWRTSPPKWLGKENPEWKGNYPVRYWDPGWQVLFVGPGGYLDQIHSQGFDGVYLDRIDVYMQWGPTGTKKPELNAPAMVQWVERIACHLRTTRGRPDAL
ncbi:MAG: cysteinyl-tRNA synthetase, partial [Myxococcota bacterium]